MKRIASAAIYIQAASDHLHTFNTPIAEGWSKVLGAMVPWIERVEAEPRPISKVTSYMESGPVGAILDERGNHE